MMLESRVAICVHCEEDVACNILFTVLATVLATATTGQKAIGSETRSDLLMMGVKTPETC
jgi:hypothetical protein